MSNDANSERMITPSYSVASYAINSSKLIVNNTSLLEKSPLKSVMALPSTLNSLFTICFDAGIKTNVACPFPAAFRIYCFYNTFGTIRLSNGNRRMSGHDRRLDELRESGWLSFVLLSESERYLPEFWRFHSIVPESIVQQPSFVSHVSPR